MLFQKMSTHFANEKIIFYIAGKLAVRLMIKTWIKILIKKDLRQCRFASPLFIFYGSNRINFDGFYFKYKIPIFY